MRRMNGMSFSARNVIQAARACPWDSHGRARVNPIVYGLRLHGLSPRVVTDPRLSLFPIRAFLARLKLTYGRRAGAAAPLSHIRRLGSGGRVHSWERSLRPYARPVRPPGSAGADQPRQMVKEVYLASDQAGFMMASSITTPAVAYCHSAISNLRAKATISGLRSRPPLRSTRCLNHWLRAESG